MNCIAKRINLLGILLLLGFTAVAAGLYFDVPARMQKSRPAATATEKYVCPMHHEVLSAKPGNCPKCGMALVATSGAALTVDSAPHGCGAEMENRCCNKTAIEAPALPPGHPPIPGFKTPSGCDYASGAITNSSQ